MMGPMTAPLILYFSALIWGQGQYVSADHLLEYLLFNPNPDHIYGYNYTAYLFSRMVLFTGLAILAVSIAQMLRSKKGLITTGLYSAVRHPQYLGIIVFTLGITIFSLAWRPADYISQIWLVQVMGYVLLALYEEQHLKKEYENEYREYRKKTAFILPIPSVFGASDHSEKREILLTMLEPLLVLFVAILILYLASTLTIR